VNSQGQAVVKMFYADTTAANKKAKLFSKDLKSKLNDGPASFNRPVILYIFQGTW
jgi:hypothetical protein